MLKTNNGNQPTITRAYSQDYLERVPVAVLHEVAEAEAWRHSSQQLRDFQYFNELTLGNLLHFMLKDTDYNKYPWNKTISRKKLPSRSRGHNM